MQPISLRLPPDLAKALDDRVQEGDLTRTDVIIAALRKHLGFRGPDAAGLLENQEALRDAVNDQETRIERLERAAGL